ncbi:uncharacterized protein LOC133202005 [Saccostrea echinata]|uniref:uncharacterized protein LOC133202005 n=1 Tax=Saccostrea echinata TaxID=191078 RepID=UPI002A80634D|nr:uncharacterized protein LOC133202005 [Saccostrea echinata]
MEGFKLEAVSAFFVACILGISAQIGANVCSRTQTVYQRQRVCAYRTWLSCCYYRYVLKCSYKRVSYCCSGYRNVNNRCIPVCFGQTDRLGCNNVGTCVAPNTCNCDSGYSGPQCDNKVACSTTRPCYPGDCPNADSCTCSTGFGSRNCTTITQSPTITLASAVLAYHHPTKLMDIYNFTTDATTIGTENASSASIWANFKRFNEIRASFSAIFGLDDQLSARPSYVSESNIGVAKATMEWELIKLRNGIPQREGGNSSACREVSETNPDSTLQECQVEFFNPLASDSGDVLTLKFEVENGGYEVLSGGVRLPFRQHTSATASVTYRIDLDKPVPTPSTAFRVVESFTKTAIETRWSGWNDMLSGMESYNWEIFELQNQSGTLRYVKRTKENCINPQFGDTCNAFLDPISSMKYNHSDEEKVMVYSPRRAGVYAMILEASDRANNSEYVARYVVYDPSSSSIEIQTGKNDIKALSGSPNASYKWQILSAPSQSNVRVEFSWEGHFINRLHQEEGFLNIIEDYKPQLEDESAAPGVFPKTVSSKYKESGTDTRPQEEIPNKLGITRFETYFDDTGEQTIDVNSTLHWSDQNLTTTFSSTIGREIREGDSVKLWVRAEDKMGNRNLSFIQLGFDATGPLLYEAMFMKNMGSKYTYGSKLWFKAADVHSGISQIYFRIINKSNGSVAENGTVNVNSSTKVRGKPDESYKVRDLFYFYQQELEINNCWFRVPKERQASDRFAVEVTAYNGAMLQNQTTVDVNLEEFNGIGQYQTVKSVILLDNTGSGVRFGWNLTETCYRRQNIILKYNDGEKHRKLVNARVNRFDLRGLKPLTRYNVSFTIEYDEGDISDPVYFDFRTASVPVAQSGLTPGGISGIVVAICLLLLFVIFVLVLYKTGRLRKAEVIIAPIRNTIRRHRDGAGAIGYQQYNTGGYEEEDIYLYGGLTFEKEPDWHYRMEDVSLDVLLKTGRFAMIYKATVYKKGNPKECVAKTLKDGYTDEDKVLMMAKINFFGTKVGEHPCILGFIGAVTSEQSIGPIMLLEYCENGTLKDWLVDRQSSVTDDVIESLFRFSYDISRGMMYLTSREIIHMRLAARNVFLSKNLSAKVAGFGPRQGDEDDESSRKERIPVKWMAPECLNKSGAASEKSDVWSYGVTVWEVFTMGGTPYDNVRSRDLPKWLKQGNRLSKPEYSDDLHYEIMKKCWAMEPSARPSFGEINKQIESLFRQSSGDLYYYDAQK